MPQLRRVRPSVGAIAAALLGVVAPLAVLPATPASAAVTDLVVNEVSSDPTDWFELANPTASDITLTGLWFSDEGATDGTKWRALTGTVPAGGVLAVDSTVGLGKGDTVTIYTGDKAAFEGGTASVIDTVTWPSGAHAATYGRCPGVGLVAMTPTKGAANNCPRPGVDEIRINEVFSDGTDFVELTNIGSVPIDINGWTAVDDDPAHTPLTIAGTSTIIEPGAYYSFEPNNAAYGGLKFGLGKGDSMTIALADGTEVDSTTWPFDTHASPSWGRCPDGLGDFETTLSATRDAANVCAAVPGAGDVKINEVSSDPTDWIELTNTGSTEVDLTGWALADNAGVAGQVPIASGTVLPAGGFLRIDFSGLGKGDSANLYLPDLLTVADTTTWTAETHATPSWGRCPDGTGTFRMTTAATPNATNSCSSTPPVEPALDPNWDDVVINEITSLNDGQAGSPGIRDAVELANTGTEAVSIEGWWQTDSGAATSAGRLALGDLQVWSGTGFVPASSWAIPAGGYVVFQSKAGLSGEGDAVKVYGPGATAVERQLVDEQVYADGAAGISGTVTSTAHAFAACPDGSDDFRSVTPSSFGRDNTTSCASAMTVVLNEVSNVAGRAELLNTGSEPVDISGWELLDSSDDVVHTVPASTTIAPGGFYLAADISGLDSADSLTIRSSTGGRVLGHEWTDDGIASYSRCELLGRISYVETPTATWGAANQCPTLGGETWPGGSAIRTVDAPGTFPDVDGNGDRDASGATFDPSDPRVLWVVANKGRLFKLHQVDGTYESFPAWEDGMPLRFADGGGEPDSEGVTVAPDGALYVTSERDNERAGSTSANVVLRYDVSGVTDATTQLVATHQWNVNDHVTTGSNLGLEGITYVPDSYLAGAGWTVGGTAYSAATYPTPGLFATAVEATGDLHFFSLATGSAPVEVKVEQSGFPFAMDVAYDADREVIWALCDNGCGGASSVLDVVGGDLRVQHSYARPAGMPNLNNEGMAIAPWSTCAGGLQEVVWADDAGTDGYSLRAGTLPCPSVPTGPGGGGGPVQPEPEPDPEPAASSVSGGDATMVYGRSATMSVSVSAAGATPTGTVTVSTGGTTLGTATVAGGAATVTLPAGVLAPRSFAYPVTLRYSGDDEVAGSSTRVSLTVERGAADLAATVSPERVVKKKTRAWVTVAVGNADGVDVAGSITVTGHGQRFTATVVDGAARVRLDRFDGVGTKTVTITYSGSDELAGQRTTATFRVVRR